MKKPLLNVGMFEDGDEKVNKSKTSIPGSKRASGDLLLTPRRVTPSNFSGQGKLKGNALKTPRFDKFNPEMKSALMQEQKEAADKLKRELEDQRTREMEDFKR